jgi:hypothetical protein
MDNRNGRRVHISFSGHETKITLAWFEPKDEGGRGFKVVNLDFAGNGVMESVDKALNILVPNWSKVCVSEHSYAVVSCELDTDPELFDNITQAVEPEQYFISRYTLEYHGGESAAMRLWNIEFQEKYASMIAFNQQAEAKA